MIDIAEFIFFKMLTATTLNYYCRVIEGIEYSDCRRRAHEKNIMIRFSSSIIDRFLLNSRQRLLSIGQIREAFARQLDEYKKSLENEVFFFHSELTRNSKRKNQKGLLNSGRQSLPPLLVDK